jgi:tRNA A37 threonylcarbamoyladenosine dehydratase
VVVGLGGVGSLPPSFTREKTSIVDGDVVDITLIDNCQRTHTVGQPK